MGESLFFVNFAAMNEFSLLMSVYKGEKAVHLKTCFDSIYNQNVPPTEIVLVEDGELSREVYEVLAEEEKRFPQLRRLPLSENQGLGTALNIGLEACRYPIVARMDTDDICLPHRFEVQIQFMQEHPEIDVLGAWISEFDDEPTNVVSIRSLPEKHDDICKFAKKRNPMNHPVVMFRKHAIIDTGGYQPCPLFEDYFLWVRMLQKGHRFHNLQQSLLLFRRSPEMIRRRGGITYTRYEIDFFRRLHHLGYITYPNMALNILQRYVVRLLPNTIRGLIYKYLLRATP